MLFARKTMTDGFVNISTSMDNLDRSLVRTSILSALERASRDFNGVLLDVGCGRMPYKDYLLSQAEQIEKYIGLDLEDNVIHDNAPDITWNEGVIPLNDGVIDCAMATEVLEHCPHPSAVLEEIYRVLRPGGMFFLTVPFIWPLHEVPYDYHRFTPFLLEKTLDECGFTNIELSALGGWDASLAQMLGLWSQRRPMGALKRKIASILVKPLHSYLLKRDFVLQDFSRQTMITGLSGTCRKPG